MFRDPWTNGNHLIVAPVDAFVFLLEPLKCLIGLRDNDAGDEPEHHLGTVTAVLVRRLEKELMELATGLIENAPVEICLRSEGVLYSVRGVRPKSPASETPETRGSQIPQTGSPEFPAPKAAEVAP